MISQIVFVTYVYIRYLTVLTHKLTETKNTALPDREN